MQISAAEEFTKRFTEQAGRVYFAKSVEEAAGLVNSIAKDRGRICCASFSLKGREFEPLVQTDIKFEELENGEALSEFAKIDVGVTLSHSAISETGSLVEISHSDNYKLLSSISKIHITIVESSNILPHLSDLAPKIRSLFQEGERPNITLIGGPSRTSDIEMKSVLGVHGPHEVHAIILIE
ncbi:MAG: lactate utilization protein [Nitrososphaerota archaeon]|nr:lactate utilization protein [Nitrososphaerota archaeon]